ncbi:MAG: PAS domain-containing protein [Marinosulfonomonas sp.]|nr:PAS domain-containing protein [Marinosulfonomonas sp.]
MGFIEKRDVYRPKTGEAPFKIDEVFFSRTDPRGVIQCSNYIFKRVSGYDWEDLLGAPHKVIRHPDMPKGVFSIFWKTLESGQPIGAYVKNKARDGLHYWVYAVAMPFDDGYLSVRIKPSSDLLGIIKKEYKALRKAEIEDGILPEESAAILEQRIQALGYANYGEFESDALTRELAARDAQLGNVVDPSVAQFTDMIAAATKLQNETEALTQGFSAISTVPTNMRILAARLEPSGGAISSLSQNYWEMSEEMSRWFQSYVSGSGSDFAAIHTTLSTSQLLLGTARILTAVASIFNRERRSLGGCDVQDEKRQMNELAAQYVSKARSGLQQVASEAQRISRAITMMRRFTLGLSSTRVMCNIESARLPVGGGSLVDIINQLGVFQGNLEKQLDQIDDLSLAIREHAESLSSSEGGLVIPPMN